MIFQKGILFNSYLGYPSIALVAVWFLLFVCCFLGWVFLFSPLWVACYYFLIINQTAIPINQLAGPSWITLLS